MPSNVTLRPMNESDTDMVVGWRNNPAVRQNFILQNTLTREDHLAWYHNRVETGEVAQFIIMVQDGSVGQPVGSVYLRDIDAVHRHAEFGIFIGEDAARGHGVGSQAARLILDYAFETLKLHKVFLRVLASNHSAVKSYEKAGFRQEGLFREHVFLNGKANDLIFMAILRQEWKDGKNAL